MPLLHLEQIIHEELAYTSLPQALAGFEDLDERELEARMRTLLRRYSRAMLRAVGFTDEDFKKPQVGIASTWSRVTPCNSHINVLAEAASDGADSSSDDSETSSAAETRSSTQF